MTIDTNGKVGIGTVSPLQPLEVKNTASAYDCTIQVGANGVGGENREFGQFAIRNNHSAAGGAYVKMQGFRDGANDSAGITFHTTSSGTAGERMRIDNAGNITPGATGTQNLGTSTLRWANVYSADLQLSNEGIEGGNEVDGTTGNWTIQEGDENLFVINRKTGKKFKMNLTEV